MFTCGVVRIPRRPAQAGGRTGAPTTINHRGKDVAFSELGVQGTDRPPGIRAGSDHIPDRTSMGRPSRSGQMPGFRRAWATMEASWSCCMMSEYITRIMASRKRIEL